VKAIQAYRFALDLTPGQERAVLAHAGAARVAHNWALARVKAVMDQRAAERTYGMPDDLLTPSMSWTLPALRKTWNAAKEQVAPWWREYSKEAFNTGLDALARGLKNWADARSGKRAGRPVGFPRFKSRRRTTPSVRFTTGTIRVEPGRKHVVLPRLGRLKLHESARKLARRLEAGTARKVRLALSEREYHCEACGLVMNRDRNASLNLAALAAEFDPAGSGPVAARGADRKTRAHGQVAMKREPSTASAGQTGTVPPQGRTADRVLARAH
jgi:putative transposase